MRTSIEIVEHIETLLGELRTSLGQSPKKLQTFLPRQNHCEVFWTDRRNLQSNPGGVLQGTENPV